MREKKASSFLDKEMKTTHMKTPQEVSSSIGEKKKMGGKKQKNKKQTNCPPLLTNVTDSQGLPVAHAVRP